MDNKIMVSVVVPEGLVAGDTFEVEVEIPTPEKKQRGQLAGLSLEEMTDEQLKREKINAGSVLYKAEQRKAPQETIDANKARLEAVKAEIAKRKPAAPEAPATEGENAVATEGETSEEGVYDADTAAEM